MFLYVNMKVHSSFPRTVHLQWLEESSKYFLLDMSHAESLSTNTDACIKCVNIEARTGHMLLPVFNLHTI